MVPMASEKSARAEIYVLARRVFLGFVKSKVPGER
jgi:hypothetical protein